MPSNINGNVIPITYNVSGLSASDQPYTAKIRVTSSSGASDYINLSLKVNPKSACTQFTASPSQVSFHGISGLLGITITDSPQTVTIKDCSGKIALNLPSPVVSPAN